MELKPGYKQTEVGVIPNDWDVASVFSLADMQKAQFDDGDWIEAEHITDKGIRLVQTGNIGVGQYIEKEARKYIYEASFDLLKCKLLEVGDLLICRLAEPAGRACVLPDIGDLKVITSVDVTIYRPSSKKANRGYLVQYFSTPQWFDSVVESVGGTTHKRISRSALGNIKLPAPSLPEQSAIATALGDVDALLSALDALITKQRDLKIAAMQQLLTGKTRLPGFGGVWETKLLGDLADVKTGPFGSALHEHDYVSDGTPIITVEHLGERGVEHVNLPMVSDADRKRLSAYSLEVGDIVFSRVGSVDRNALIREVESGWLFSGRLLRVRPNRRLIYSEFLSYQFHSERFKFDVLSVAVGQTMASLNTKILNGISVHLPSIEEQTAIAEVLSGMDAQLAALEQQREKTALLKQGMMQELLTGRTRLVQPAAQAASNVVEFSTVAAKPQAHNWAINEAVVISMLVKKFGNEQYPLGRKRCTKLAYLMHRHVEHVAEGYRKKAAGPYNPDVKYRGPEGIAQKNGYIRQHKSGSYSGFIAAEKISEAENYFLNWYGQDVLNWLEQFRKKTNDELELLATVDMAAEDLRLLGAAATLKGVKSVIANHSEWQAKLEREIFSDSNIRRAIQRVGELFAE